MSNPQHFDVIIIGGAMIGSSIAWWLTQNPDFTGTIAIIEADPSFEFAATSHTNSCIRQQFGSDINIQISQFGAEFVRNFRDHMGPDAPEIPIQNFGYLYLADTQNAAEALTKKAERQNALGAPTKTYTQQDLAARFPFYALDDIVGASHNTKDEGYFDGGTVFDFYRRRADATRITGRITAIQHTDGRATGVTLADGTQIGAGTIVNAAGTRANQIMQMVGLSLPIEPRKRFTWVFQAANPLPEPLPLTIDPRGVHVRSEGHYYMAGAAPLQDGPVAHDDFAFDHDLWESHVWPIIATRIPAFEQIKVIQEWTGHYDYNTFDQNAILGPHPDMPNLIMANGFSGHGLQQAPAVGRGLAEWITYGAYKTLDLSPLGYGRITENRANLEHNVI